MWPFKKKNKVSKQTDLQVSRNFHTILSSHAGLKAHFDDLVRRFEKRTWTPAVCSLFKALAEELFQVHGLKTTFHIEIMGDVPKSFSVEIHED